MKVLIDTNIILDVLCDRPRYCEDSAKIMKLCEVKRLKGYVSALSVANIIYILQKDLDAKKTKEVLDKLSLIFSIEDLKADDIKKAGAADFDDYKDALQSVTAKRLHANYIITRNTKDFHGSTVKALDPAMFLKEVISA